MLDTKVKKPDVELMLDTLYPDSSKLSDDELTSRIKAKTDEAMMAMLKDMVESSSSEKEEPHGAIVVDFEDKMKNKPTESD